MSPDGQASSGEQWLRVGSRGCLHASRFRQEVELVPVEARERSADRCAREFALFTNASFLDRIARDRGRAPPCDEVEFESGCAILTMTLPRPRANHTDPLISDITLSKTKAASDRSTAMRAVAPQGRAHAALRLRRRNESQGRTPRAAGPDGVRARRPAVHVQTREDRCKLRSTRRLHENAHGSRTVDVGHVQQSLPDLRTDSTGVISTIFGASPLVAERRSAPSGQAKRASLVGAHHHHSAAPSLRQAVPAVRAVLLEALNREGLRGRIVANARRDRR